MLLFPKRFFILRKLSSSIAYVRNIYIIYSKYFCFDCYSLVLVYEITKFSNHIRIFYKLKLLFQLGL